MSSQNAVMKKQDEEPLQHAGGRGKALDRPKKSAMRENVEAILIAIVLALFIRHFAVQAFKIPSGSMLPTLQIGDHILVFKSIYGIRLPFADEPFVRFEPPKRGDIIVFRPPHEPGKDYIKRVIGVPGDTVEVRNKRVYVNGDLLPDVHAVHRDPRTIPGGVHQPRDFMKTLKVPPGHLFVMGDNRDFSLDSRFWGFVDLNKVKGKAWRIYFSWDSDSSTRIRWDRLGRLVE